MDTPGLLSGMLASRPGLGLEAEKPGLGLGLVGFGLEAVQTETGTVM